jgi:hypothetical protein
VVSTGRRVTAGTSVDNGAINIDVSHDSEKSLRES